jgi:Protein of unknown function (DUF4242)
VTEFLVELYVARKDGGSAERGAERAHAAAEELTREGTPVRVLRSIFVPEDETCFLLYEATSAADVRDAVGRAALSLDRVVEAAPARHREES